MGYATCPGRENHPDLHTGDVKVCWRCDRCPREFGFRLRRGDYCPDCVAKMKADGLVYDAYSNDYVKPPTFENRGAELLREVTARYKPIYTNTGGWVDEF